MNKKLPDYLTWHLTIVPLEVTRAWLNFLQFNFHFFSTGLLLRTLFAPWKRQVIVKRSSGFNFEDWFTMVSFNLVSRGIGAIVRSALIIWALIFGLLIFLLGPFFLILTLFTPLISLPSYLAGGKERHWQKIVGKVKEDPKTFLNQFLRGEEGKFVFRRLGLTEEQKEKVLKETCSSLVNEEIISFSDQEKVAATFYQLFLTWPPLNRAMNSLSVSPGDIEAVCRWFDLLQVKEKNRGHFWSRENLLRQRSLATELSYGYTINLDLYSENLTHEFSFTNHLVGRDTEVERIETILCRNGQNNVILVGQEGVGKRTVVLQFAKNIWESRVYPPLKHKRVLELNVIKILGSEGNSLSAQNLFNDILEEAVVAGNVILVIPGIDRFVSNEAGRVDLTPSLSKIAASGRVQIIGITTPELYHKYLYSNSTIGKLFETIEISPPDKSQAIEILETFVNEFEKGKNITVTFQAVREAVEKSDRYLTEIPFPEKAIDLLDETVVTVISKGETLVTAKDVDTVLSVKIKIPIGEISREEKDKLIDLEEVIHRRLINQEEAVTGLANAFRRARTNISDSKKPAGVFLFLGPTGVGKTETAKALAEAYFGSDERLARLDMNEFQDEGANIRLLGYFEKNEPGILTKILRDNPFCVLLLDEIEKASRQILNLLLTAFDEGYLTDNFGRKISLKEMIIIGTSNAGANFIREKVGTGVKTEDFRTELLDKLMKEGVFTPEFLNRFDAVIIYKPLSFEHLKEIARLFLEKINKKLKEKEVSIKITDELLSKIAEEGNDPVFGARPMRRLIQDRIEAPLAQKLLKGEMTKGSTLEIDPLEW